MDYIMSIFNWLIDAGPTVMLPIIMTVVGLVVGLNFRKAFQSGLTIGIGFVGIRLILDFLAGNLGPAAQAMAERLGVQLDVLDVGWGSIAAITWASPIIIFLVVAIFITNIVMILLKVTNTLDIDIWNYHHMAIVGIMVHFVTGSISLGILATIVMAATTFKIADWTQPYVEEFFGIPGVSLPTVSSTSSMVIAWPVNWILDHIPGIRKINFKLDDIQKYLGLFGEQSVLGLILGTIIGLLGGYSISEALQLGVQMAAVLIIIPTMTSFFVEGLMPISEAAQKWSQEKFKGRELLMGLDAAVIVGNQDVINTALMLIPLTLGMALVLPGNRMLPFADLAIITFRIALPIALTRGNFFRNIIIGLITTAAILYGGTLTGPLLTEIAGTVGIDISTLVGGAAVFISSFSATSLTHSLLVFLAFTGPLYITLPLLAVGIAAYWIVLGYINPKKDKSKNLSEEH